MKRFSRLPITITNSDDQDIVVVRFDANSIAAWCLDLCLLERDLAESIVVASDKGSFKLEIKRDLNLAPHVRGRAWWHSDRIELLVSATELEMWLHFFLKYYRDDLGEVDHIDVNILRNNFESTRDLFLTFKVPNVLPPLSESEIRRNLGNL